MAKIQLRRDTTANWASANPVLAEGEVGIDTTLRIRKTGDGVRTWSKLQPELLGDRSWSFTDNFMRSTGPVGANYQQFIYRTAGDYVAINGSNRAYRTTSQGTPGGTEWADGVILSQDTGSLAQRVVLSGIATDAQDDGGFIGYPGVSAILRGPGTKLARGGIWTANNTGAKGVGQAIFGMLKRTNFHVVIASPGANTTPNANDSIQDGWCAFSVPITGYVANTKELVVQITSDDIISATYGGVEILSPRVLPGAPQGRYVGFSPGSINGSLAQFSASVLS